MGRRRSSGVGTVGCVVDPEPVGGGAVGLVELRRDLSFPLTEECGTASSGNGDVPLRGTATSPIPLEPRGGLRPMAYLYSYS